MSIPICTVDAFSDKVFSGNTCAVCVLEKWLDDSTLLQIAQQNLFAETAFILISPNQPLQLRWFTVSKEVNFCGYGTLSAGYVFLNHYASSDQTDVIFHTRNYGTLKVSKQNQRYYITAKSSQIRQPIWDNNVIDALGGSKPQALIPSERGDLIILYDNEDEVKSVQPDFKALMMNEYFGYILTSKGQKSDYVYRYFSPRMMGTWEDPVNGASQSVLIPYWGKRLDKTTLIGQAVSKRGGTIYGEITSDSAVQIGGDVVPYLQGHIML